MGNKIVSEVYALYHNKKLISTYDSYNSAFSALLKEQPNSVDHAIKYEGWKIELAKLYREKKK